MHNCPHKGVGFFNGRNGVRIPRVTLPWVSYTYQVVYGRPPSIIPPYIKVSSHLEAINSELVTGEQFSKFSKSIYPNGSSEWKIRLIKRSDVEFKEVDIVYVK